MNQPDPSLVATYVSEVLGVRSLLLNSEVNEAQPERQINEPASLAGVEKEIQSQEAVVIFLSMRTPRSSLLQGPGFELFKKMRAATKWEAKQAPVIELNPRELDPRFSLPQLELELGLTAPPRYVVFSCELISKLGYGVHKEGERFNFDGRELLCTFDPRVLLKDQEKKKAVWEDLKSLMKELQS